MLSYPLCLPLMTHSYSSSSPDTFDAVVGAWRWLRTSSVGGRQLIAFDGKTVRGARDAAGNLVHLVAGLCQRTAVVIGQVAVGAKTNEIPMLAG